MDITGIKIAKYNKNQNENAAVDALIILGKQGERRVVSNWRNLGIYMRAFELV